jgi:hypothetical protein
MLISNPLEKLHKTNANKIISEKSNRKWTIFSFITMCKNFGLHLFWVSLFALFSTDSYSASNFVFYDTPFELLGHFFGLYCTFC